MRLALFACSAFAYGQVTGYEVASIKPSPKDAQCGMIGPTQGGGLKVECLSLKTMLVWAYDIQSYQVIGGPSWMESDRWTILAKSENSGLPEGSPTNFAEMNDAQRKQGMGLVRERLKLLMADRFGLLFHHETREQTFYELNIAKGGPKLVESGETSAGMARRGRGLIALHGAQLDALVRFLGSDLGRPVEDKTGLKGHYEFELKWTPDNATAEESGPTLFTALQEQLGLRVDSKKGPVDVLVIDRAEKASEN